MSKISEKDWHSLELKIQTELKKIVTQFMEDLEKRDGESGGTKPPQEPRKTRRSRRRVHGKTSSAPAGLRKYRRPGKPLDTNKILHGALPAVKDHPGDVIEEDIRKIFGKRYRKPR